MIRIDLTAGGGEVGPTTERSTSRSTETHRNPSEGKPDATNGDDGPSFFARYIDEPDGRRSPAAGPPGSRKTTRLVAAQMVPAHHPRQNIYQYGPGPTRDKESTLKLTAILERRGYLVPMKTRRYDTKMWRITIGD